MRVFVALLVLTIGCWTGQAEAQQATRLHGANGGCLSDTAAAAPSDTACGLVTRSVGTQSITAATLPLPTGASTEATLASLLTELAQKTEPTDTQPVSGTFWQATQPVSLAVAPTTPVTGTFWQSTQPVSLAVAPTTPVTGTFWQATQPVSAASLPLPTGASTETTLASLLTELQAKADLAETQPVSLASVPSHPVTNAGTFAVQAALNAETTKVIGTVNQGTSPWVVTGAGGTFPVTGTFWQATQPVSGTVTVTDGAGALNVIVDSGTVTTVSTVTNLSQMAGAAISMNTGVRDAGTQRVTIATNDSVPVTGTFWQTTQPVSGTFWQTTQPVSGTVTANPATYAGKTLTYVPVNQGAAGTTALAAAQGSNKHKIVGAMLTLSVEGTMKFTDGVGDLTGPMDVGATGGFVLPTSMLPYTETGAINRALNLVTTLGAARGVVVILSEP